MRGENKTTRPMFEPRVENGKFVIRFHDGTCAAFPLPDKDNKDVIREQLCIMRRWALLWDATTGQAGIDEVGNGGTIIKAFRKAGFYLTQPHFKRAVLNQRRVVLGVEDSPRLNV